MVKVILIGSSFEKRPLYVMKVDVQIIVLFSVESERALSSLCLAAVVWQKG